MAPGPAEIEPPGDRQVKRAHLGVELGPTWVEKGVASPICGLSGCYVEAEDLLILPLAFIDSRKR